ncbi:MAG: glutathione peroxidase [Anaerolineae bacterium]|nr:glutathione peroxidase [Phycisphaerae bacterium]
MNKTIATIALMLSALLVTCVLAGDDKKEGNPVPPVLNFKMKSLAGEEVDLSKYQGKVVLMVNTASKCGYTPQYKDLEALYKKYQDKGLVVLGFPADNFGHQEPGTDTQIAEFCQKSFGVTFPMFSKVSVKGADEVPLFKLLTTQSPDAGEIKWNFEKFLISRDGKIMNRFRSKVNPSSDEVAKAVEAELTKS